MGLIGSLLKRRGGKGLQPGRDMNWGDVFLPAFGSTYDPRLNDVYMGCVQAHARMSSMFTPEVYRNDVASTDPAKAYLNRLLSVRPNPVMNAATFWERVAALYYQENNAFIFLDWDFTYISAPLRALWILDPVENAVEVKVTDTGQVVFSFNLNGTEMHTDLANIVHLARHVENNILGEKNQAIQKVIDIISINYEGIEAAVRTSAFIRFVITGTTLTNPEVRKQRAEDFAKTYLGTGSSGIIYLDGASTLTQINSTAKYANEAEMKLFENKIYNYMNISEPILKATYTDDQYNAYMDSALGPLAIKLEQELSYKIFTPKELSFGDRIAIINDRTKAMSMKTKIAIAQVVLKLPTYRPNDINRLIGMPVTEGGEKELANLNWTHDANLDEYQDVGKEKPVEVVEEAPVPGAKGE